MLPTLLQIGPLAISSQGFFLVLAFLTGAFFVWRKGTEENFDATDLMDAVVLAAIISLVWARIFFVLFSGVAAWGKIFNFFTLPGFSYFGALFGGGIFLGLFAARKKWDFFKLSDVFVFGVVPAQLLIRLGNLLDGSFGGRETNLFWGVRLPGVEKTVHPLALYEIIFLIGLLFLVKNLERQYRLFEWYKDRRGEAAPGFLFLTYTLYYSSFRFLLEFAKTSRLYWYGLGWEQWLALFLVLVSLVLFYNRAGRKFKDLLAPLAKKWQSFKKRKTAEKVEILVPMGQTRRVIPKKPFHFKVGMDARGK